MATATQTHPIDLDEITTHTHDITAIQTVITDELQGATALDINGHPVSLLDTTGDTLKEAALEMQNYFNLYVQDVVRDFLIEDVTYDHNTIIVTLTGEISVNTENRCSNPQYLWSQVIIAATPRNHSKRQSKRNTTPNQAPKNTSSPPGEQVPTPPELLQAHTKRNAMDRQTTRIKLDTDYPRRPSPYLLH